MTILGGTLESDEFLSLYPKILPFNLTMFERHTPSRGPVHVASSHLDSVLQTGVAPSPSSVRNRDSDTFSSHASWIQAMNKSAPAHIDTDVEQNSKQIDPIENIVRPSDAAVAHWIGLALGPGKGESFLMTRRLEWSKSNPIPNINLVAAERFMGGYEGLFNEASLGLQYFGKHFRDSALASAVRERAPQSAWSNQHFVMLFGRNGSPANTVDFTTRWALSGIGHRYMNIKPGSGLSPVKCKTNSRIQ
jgi:hypothetical protein